MNAAENSIYIGYHKYKRDLVEVLAEYFEEQFNEKGSKALET